MTTADINLPSLAQRARELSQATAIEQARAVAEVQAAIVVAQQCPRDIDAAITGMQQTTAQRALAERAFFSYSRAGSSITGPSIHLARELARVWGNIQYGITELRRDDAKGESEMLAFAWDVQTNTRNSNSFIVPHARDTKSGRKPIIDLRDVYENNANLGARRVREAIFAVLPTWYTEDAKQRCYATLEAGNGDTLEQRIRGAVEAFGKAGITEEQLAEKFGRIGGWTEADVAQVGITYQSLLRREVSKEEVFGDAHRRVTVAEIKRDDPTTEHDPTTDPNWKAGDQ